MKLGAREIRKIVMLAGNDDLYAILEDQDTMKPYHSFDVGGCPGLRTLIKYDPQFAKRIKLQMSLSTLDDDAFKRIYENQFVLGEYSQAENMVLFSWSNDVQGLLSIHEWRKIFKKFDEDDWNIYFDHSLDEILNMIDIQDAIANGEM